MVGGRFSISSFKVGIGSIDSDTRANVDMLFNDLERKTNTFSLSLQQLKRLKSFIVNQSSYKRDLKLHNMFYLVSLLIVNFILKMSTAVIMLS